ncbi:hypothetical protein SynBIOSU31_02720 [Synechococcus sp. BIOS-U3-1]|nr:hypothetical protein SynBIOSU31_02720 [Synechococcus sp. BIOS-U3-1]
MLLRGLEARECSRLIIEGSRSVLDAHLLAGRFSSAQSPTVKTLSQVFRTP